MELLNVKIMRMVILVLDHNLKKRKDGLEGSLDWVYLRPNLNSRRYSTLATSEYIKWKHWMFRKIKAIVFVLVIILLEHWCLYLIVLTLICFQLIMPKGNCEIYGCPSSRTTPGVSQYRSNTRGTTFLQIIPSFTHPLSSTCLEQ